ncbi:MAG TPA: VCBS repeat-containing protein [Bacteroidales bacterium]|nr:VCBS repeat-containing protein [Bacteroidales bacterium]
MKRFAPVLSLLLLLFSCKQEIKEKTELFTLMSPDSTNVRFVNRLTETEQFNIIQYLYFNNGAGVAAGDINNDGLTDLYFTSNQNGGRLYLNKGNMQFEDITTKAGVQGSGDWMTGVTMADVNGDDLLDIYVCQVGNYKVIHGRNQLFLNQGDLTFRDEAHEYGLDFCGFSTQAAFLDYDLDGDLDMYLLNHSVHTSRSYGPVSLRFDHDPLSGDRLYRNDEVNGKRYFHDVANEAGIYDSQIGYGLGISTGDINNDGWPDIYISNDFHEDDYLYINNRNGTFTDRFRESMQHTSRSSMGNDIGDFNNDGLQDVIVLDMLPENEKTRKKSGGEDDLDVYQIKLGYGYGYQFVRNTLQLNLGGGVFSETGRLAGIFSTDWSWSPLFCDVDNDGFKDIFITNGIYRRSNDLDYIRFMTNNNFFESESNKNTPDSVLYQKMPLDKCVNYIYRNNGDLTFTNMATEWGFSVPTFSNGSAYADLDNDGDPDLVTNNINDPACIYRNNASSATGNHFLSVKLKGKGLNTHAIGARVTLYYDGKMQAVEHFPTRGFMSSSTGDMHFGLGSAESIDSVIVRWPDLTEEVIRNVSVDREIIADIDNARVSAYQGSVDNYGIKLLSASTIEGLDYKHVEDPFISFKHELLVPHTLFAEGPALVVSDFNNDGREDIFAGSSKNQPSAIFMQQENGSFSKADVPAFIKDLLAEDVDAAAFDADGDKDNDLYIVRGGSEVSLGNQLLADRLLINDGKGGLSESLQGSLPPVAYNGSCAEPCDFDKDGDIDLFVGSRSIPGAYGLSPKQLLLENDGKGKFTDVTDIRMKRLAKCGMVTDASWTDYDSDGDMDLILVGEWMKVTVLSNNDGIFSDATSEAGLDDTEGWWNSLHLTDIDKDGDMDLIAGNHGLNTMYKASMKEPVELYINDFDDNGTLDHLMCAYCEGVSYPVASLDQLKSQIPGIEKKFRDYADFGGKTVKDMFGSSAVSRAVVKKAVLFESCIFLNDGKGVFKKVILPVEAQFSPVRGILTRDLNNDGTVDIILAGNDYTIKPSFGRQDASYGWCLLNEGPDGFKALKPYESGFLVKGDSRKVLPVKIAGKQHLVVAVNDSDLRVFECLK